MRLHRWTLGAAAGVLLVTGAVFWPAAQFEFLSWDDDINIIRNDLIKGLDLNHLTAMFLDTGQAMRYKPLSWLAWALIHGGSGLQPAAYHLFNVLLHGANAVLVFLLIRRLLAKPAGLSPARPGQVILCAALGALLWAVHPLRVEPVAWVTGMPYGLALLFLLVSVHCYLAAMPVDESGRLRSSLYWVSVACFGLALLTYPVVLGFVGVLVVLDVYPLRRLGGAAGWWRSRTARQVWLEKVPFVAATGVFVGIALLGRLKPVGVWEEGAGLQSFGVGSRLLQACYIWGHYFWKPWFPFDLSPLYTTLVSFRPTDPALMASVLLVAAVTGLLVLQRYRWPGLLALWVCHLALLVPSLGLTEHPHFPCDRYGHLAGLLWPIALAAGLCWLVADARTRLAGWVVGGVLVGVLVAASSRQLGIWRNDVVFFTELSRKTAGTAYASKADYFLGLAHINRSQHAQALEPLHRVLDESARRSYVHEAAGEAHLRLRQYAEAKVHYLAVHELKPKNVPALANLAGVCAELGQHEEAKAYWLAALQLTPKDAGILNSVGIECAILRQHEAARGYVRQAVAVDPNLPAAYHNLGLVLTEMNRTEEAKACFDKARDLGGQSRLSAN